jgi:hypothetical protein
MIVITATFCMFTAINTCQSIQRIFNNDATELTETLNEVATDIVNKWLLSHDNYELCYVKAEKDGTVSFEWPERHYPTPHN